MYTCTGNVDAYKVQLYSGRVDKGKMEKRKERSVDLLEHGVSVPWETSQFDPHTPYFALI